MSSDREQLQEMGFAPDRVSWALRVTGNSGLQAAMDHLVEHSEEPVPSEEEQSVAGQVLEHENDVVNSILCADCGKRFRNQAYAQFHAEKSGHTSFEESTEELAPLTEEEKKAKLEEMRKNLAEKRAKQSIAEKEEAKRNEMIRRKAGQESGAAKEELQAKQRIREAQQKQRERQADLEAKQRVRQQIEADKRERAERIRIEKARREGRLDDAATMASGGTVTSTTTTTTTSQRSTPTATTSKKIDSDQARLRVRLNNGQMWQGTLPADSTLAELEAKILADGKTDGTKLSLSTTYPRKVFTDTEKGSTLRELGLVPNAALEGHATM